VSVRLHFEELEARQLPSGVFHVPHHAPPDAAAHSARLVHQAPTSPLTVMSSQADDNAAAPTANKHPAPHGHAAQITSAPARRARPMFVLNVGAADQAVIVSPVRAMPSLSIVSDHPAAAQAAAEATPDIPVLAEASGPAAGLGAVEGPSADARTGIPLNLPAIGQGPPGDIKLYSVVSTVRSGGDAGSPEQSEEDSLFPELRDDPDAMPALEQMPALDALPSLDVSPAPAAVPPLTPIPSPDGPSSAIAPAASEEQRRDPPRATDVLALCATPLLPLFGTTPARFRKRLRAGLRAWRKLHGYYLRDC
jgi:hypothetical protein